jgi:hypothetical protein
LTLRFGFTRHYHLIEVVFGEESAQIAAPVCNPRLKGPLLKNVVFIL